MRLIKKLSVCLALIVILCIPPLCAYSEDRIGPFYIGGDYNCPEGYILVNTGLFFNWLSEEQYSVKRMPGLKSDAVDPADPFAVEGAEASPDYKKQIKELERDCPLVLVVGGFNGGWAHMFAFQEQSALNKPFEEFFPHGGFSIITVQVKKVCRNTTGIEVKEGDYLTVKEDFYCYNGVLYTKYGTRQNPLYGDSLVFASIAPEDEKTPLYIFDNDFRIPINGRATPPDSGPAWRSDAEMIAKKYGNEILSYFGLEKNPEYPAAGWVLPVLVGAGVLVCVVPAAVVLAVRKRKKRSAPAGQP